MPSSKSRFVPLLLIVFVTAAPLWSQTSGNGKEDAQRPKEPATTRPESAPADYDPTHAAARDWLKKAAAKQCDAAVPEISSFSCAAQFVYFEYDDKGAASQKPGDIEWVWAKGKNRAGEPSTAYRRTLRSDAGGEGTQVLSFEDVCWKPGKGEQTPLMTADYKQDRERIGMERRRITQLLGIFFLSKLAPDSKALRVVAEEESFEYEIGNQKYAAVAVVIETTDAERNRLRLWIDKKSFEVVRAQVLWAKTEAADDYYFGSYWPAKIGAAKVQIPLRIQYREKGRAVIQITSTNTKSIRFNDLAEKEAKQLFDFIE